MSLSRDQILRTAKLSLALALIGLSLWALFLPPMFPASMRSLVNARGVSIQAQDAGRIEEIPFFEGNEVDPGAVVARVGRNQRQVQRELDDLEFLRRKLQTQIAHLDEALALRRADLDQRSKELEMLQAEFLASMRSRQANAQATLDIAAREHEVRRTSAERLQPLYEDGIITAAQWQQAQEQLVEASRVLHSAQSEAERLGRGIAQAGAGVGVGDSPVGESIQRAIDNHRLEIQKQEMQRIELQIQHQSAEHQIAVARDYLQAGHFYEVASPVEGVVWQRLALNGQSVMPGDEILRIADGSTLFVEAYFGRHFIDSIAVGDHAHIYLIGAGRFVHGTVRQIQSQEQGAAEHNIIRSLPPDASMLKVLIEVRPDSLGVDEIGQLAKVMISRARPGLLKRGMVWLSFALRSAQ